jgi:hypothetical protein
MQEKLTISCPKCGESFPLDETLAGPMIAQVRAEAGKLISASKREAEEKIDALATKEAAMAIKEKELADREASIKSAVNQAMAAERQLIAQTERENIRKELAPELDAEKRKATELATQLEISQKAELALRQQRDELEQRTKALDLEVARKVDDQRQAIQEQASKDADEKTRLRLAEKDKTISDMQLKLEEAQRKAIQGSQQMQGEVLELDFEATLRQFFPQDTIESVKAGARGGDVLQRVLGEMGRSVGTMFWETKRTQSWGGDWASKAKQDAMNARAEIAIIVSEVLPKGIHDFGLFEGVWTVRPSHAVVLGVALRHGIISTADARQGAIGKESKMERLYAYMIGQEFRSTIEGIALPFRELHEELIAEKRATLSRWKRQERRIERVLSSVASLQGDLQGIAGSEMPELPGFESDAGVQGDDEA